VGLAGVQDVVITISTPDGSALPVPDVDHSDLVLMWWRDVDLSLTRWQRLSDLWFHVEPFSEQTTEVTDGEA
jgi:hypothetical protein